jgi:thiamine-monophosphate kinase
VAETAGVTVTRIGRIIDQAGLRLLDGAGDAMQIRERGFDHFA